MALLICYWEPSSAVDWTRKAIYLDQTFYETMYRYFEKRKQDSVLRRMVALGYDDELFVLSGDIKNAVSDIDRITLERVISHPQLSLLRKALHEAASRGWGIAVAGDMYPDLSRG